MKQTLPKVRFLIEVQGQINVSGITVPRFVGLRREEQAQGLLLIGPPSVFEPTCRVPPFRVVVRPVDRTALFVPHVLAVEAYIIAFL